MKVLNTGQLTNRVKSLRLQRGWSQVELARQAGLSRSAVSAIEIQRLTPSVAVAIALAQVFDCRVEDLFFDEPIEQPFRWAWPAAADPCRFWHAGFGTGTLLYPVEPSVAAHAHDGVYRNGVPSVSGNSLPERTLVLATCDPAAGLLADELVRATGYRLLVLPRSSRTALDLLQKGLVHLAGMHLARANDQQANIEAAHSILGSGHSLVSVANWEEGLSIGKGVVASSVTSILRSKLRWVGREQGSGARQCQDEVLESRPQPRRLARDHRGIVEAIRCGWADVGVCVRLVSTEAGLRFVSVREEAYQLCFPNTLDHDPRLCALLETIRSLTYRRLLSELPGYHCRNIGEVAEVR